MSKNTRGGGLARFFRRLLLLVFTGAVLLLIGGYTLLGTVLTGPSRIARDALTQTLMADSNTDWIPGLYLDEGLIAQICE